MIRDRGCCQFTDCHRTRHLRAHHVVHWADGGPTDLGNLILLGQFQHTAVHEGAMIIRRTDSTTGSGWQFPMPDATPHRDWYSTEGLLAFLAQHADSTTSYDRHGAVQALFRMPIAPGAPRAA